MKSKIITKTTIILKLEENEANWLKGIVQNPIGCTLEDEGEENKKMRMSFWEALGGDVN